MGYRGEDLDLRTAQSWVQGSERGAYEAGARTMVEGAQLGVGERAPIYVDETLLASCNHAYDVALAHRAAEVRIEHLLYALTRIDAAAEILETYGIRDASLRRESATVIASEIPIGLTNGAGKPRRSKALEDALRLAADHARRRNATASVADLLTVFLDLDPGLPGLELLRRHLSARPDYRAAVAAPTPAYEPLPEPVYEPLPPRERPRRAVRQNYAADLYAEPREEPRRPVTRAETSIDAQQNARLEQLERLVRDLRQDLAEERSAFSGVLHSLQRDVSANRDDHGRMSEGLTDRLMAFERTMMNTRDSSGETLAETLSRVIEMERRLSQRLEAISHPAADLPALIARLERIEKSQAEERAAVQLKLAALHDRVSFTPLFERFDRVEAAQTGERAETVRSIASLAERLRTLEGAVADQRIAVDLSPIEGRLGDIETAVLSLEGSEAADSLGKRLETIEAAVVSRMAALTEMVGSRFVGLDQRRAEDRTATLQQLAAVSQTVSRQQADVLAQINERVTDLIGQSMSALVTQHMAPMTRTVGEMRTLTADTASRLDTMDASLLRQAQETAEARETYGRELGEVHEAIVKLNTNQHTLAGAIDRWRSDQVADMNTIGKHLAQLDRDNDAPIARLEFLSERMDGMYRATVERYHRRNRFWFWLFGTDDWLGASWPSQTAKVEDELRVLQARKPHMAAGGPPA